MTAMVARLCRSAASEHMSQSVQAQELFSLGLGIASDSSSSSEDSDSDPEDEVAQDILQGP